MKAVKPKKAEQTNKVGEPDSDNADRFKLANNDQNFDKSKIDLASVARKSKSSGQNPKISNKAGNETDSDKDDEPNKQERFSVDVFDSIILAHNRKQKALNKSDDSLKAGDDDAMHPDGRMKSVSFQPRAKRLWNKMKPFQWLGFPHQSTEEKHKTETHSSENQDSPIAQSQHTSNKPSTQASLKEPAKSSASPSTDTKSKPGHDVSAKLSPNKYKTNHSTPANQPKNISVDGKPLVKGSKPATRPKPKSEKPLRGDPKANEQSPNKPQAGERAENDKTGEKQPLNLSSPKRDEAATEPQTSNTPLNKQILGSTAQPPHPESLTNTERPASHFSPVSASLGSSPAASLRSEEDPTHKTRLSINPNLDFDSASDVERSTDVSLTAMPNKQSLGNYTGVSNADSPKPRLAPKRKLLKLPKSAKLLTPGNRPIPE